MQIFHARNQLEDGFSLPLHFVREIPAGYVMKVSAVCENNVLLILSLRSFCLFADSDAESCVLIA